MTYYGDRPAGENAYFYFSTNDSSGGSVTMTDATTASVRVYKDNGVDEYTTDGDFDLSIDHDGVTGMHVLEVDTDNAFFSIGCDFGVCLVGVTIDGETVNVWVGSFSIQNRSNTLLATTSALAAVKAETALIVEDTGTTLPAEHADIETSISEIEGGGGPSLR
jgi:hypothetical protein